MENSFFLEGYRFEKAPFYQSKNSIIFKGLRESTQEKVVVKLTNLPASQEHNKRLNLEFKLVSALNANPCIIKVLDLIDYEHSLALIFEYISFPSLKEILKTRKKLSLIEGLYFALNLAKALQAVHEKNIIHKDINPANILYDLNSQAIKLLDFSLSVNLPKEFASLHLKNLEGTLAYMAPEQSGRMNRGIDYRSDYYSLGVTLYQTFTGTLPFIGEDALEIIHKHLTLTPPSPHVLDSAIPEPLANIIMKLMMKNAQERYQSLGGLIYDLEYCLKSLEKKGFIETFPIALEDKCSRFQIPEKLYGREKEIHFIMQAYQASVTGDPSLVLIGGEPGIGKTSLVNEIHKPATKEKAYFLSGKFEQFKRYLPFSAFIQAFDSLVQQILCEDPLVVKKYKEDILKAVDGKGQLLLDLIPNLKAILGAQPLLPPISPDRAGARLSHTFYQFIRAINKKEHPLILFLDDVQWIDDASLHLLADIISLEKQEKRFLLFITTYRNTEVDDTHPFIKKIAELREEGLKIHDIFLSALSSSQVEALLADSLYQPLREVAPLAAICHAKTAGNPFFLNQLLFSLVEEGWIHFNSKSNGWSWQIEKIKNACVSTNVVELLTKKIHLLSPNTQKVLENAACIGSLFSFNLLASLSNSSKETVQESLEELQKEGLIYKEEAKSLEPNYLFAHDRIQQAALSLMSEKIQRDTHLRLARFILNSTLEKDLNERLFTLLEHYNTALSKDLLEELGAEEKHRIATLNLRAANLSKASGAYFASLKFIEKALSCVTQELWSDDYPLIFELYLNAAEAAYLSAHYEKVDALIKLSRGKAQTKTEHLKLLNIQIKAYSSQLKPKEVVALVREALILMGISFPKRIKTYHILSSLLKAHLKLLFRVPTDCINQEELQDSAEKALAVTVNSAFELMYRTLPEAYVVLISTLTLHYMQAGTTPGVPTLYAAFAMFEMGIFNAIKKGLDLYEVAEQLFSKHPTEEEKAALTLFSHFLHHKLPLAKVIARLKAGFEPSYQAGFFITAFNIGAVEIGYSLFSADSLEAIQKRTKYYLSLAEKTKQVFSSQGFILGVAFLPNFQVPDPDPTTLKFKDTDESIVIKRYKENTEITHLALAYYFKTFLGVVFERYAKAWEFSLSAEPYLPGFISLYFLPCFYFFQALTALQLLDKAKGLKLAYKRRIFRALRKLKKHETLCPYNYASKLYLLRGEYASKIRHDEKEAKLYFTKAIQAAKENHLLLDEALACEFAAKHYHTYNWPREASFYMRQAKNLYSLWGAKAKVLHLEEHYAFLLRKDEESLPLDLETSLSQTSSDTDISSLSSSLDLKTILKAARALPTTLILRDLLDALTNMLIENMGAERCVLILEKEGQFFIEAEKSTKTSQSSFLESIPLSEESLPLSLIHRLINEKKPLLIKEALQDAAYNKDPYVIKHEAKSLLGLPLIKKGRLYGLLYLENNKAGALFSKERLDLLKLLLAQITISIDNAKLYSETLELNHANERFVPAQFLNILKQKSIRDVQLGQHAEEVMSVMFLDIRNFTSLSEKMTPEENFNFINGFLSIMAPFIRQHQGIIDKYIGDAIMALFPEANEALTCALDLLKGLKSFNQKLAKDNKEKIKIGIGINTGAVMIGTLGESNRMNVTVISDAVNLASRVEGLSKNYLNTPIIITEHTYLALKEPLAFKLKPLDIVHVKGKEEEIRIWGIEDL